jgi:hypothetical protein
VTLGLHCCITTPRVPGDRRHHPPELLPSFKDQLVFVKQILLITSGELPEYQGTLSFCQACAYLLGRFGIARSHEPGPRSMFMHTSLTSASGAWPGLCHCATVLDLTEISCQQCITGYSNRRPESGADRFECHRNFLRRWWGYG